MAPIGYIRIVQEDYINEVLDFAQQFYDIVLDIYHKAEPVKEKTKPKNRCDMRGKWGLAGNVPFKSHYSWVHGKKLTTWSGYHKANEEAGIIDCGVAPEHPKDTTVPFSPKQGQHVPCID